MITFLSLLWEHCITRYTELHNISDFMRIFIFLAHINEFVRFLAKSDKLGNIPRVCQFRVLEANFDENNSRLAMSSLEFFEEKLASRSRD